MNWEALFSQPSGFDIGVFLLLVAVYWGLRLARNQLDDIAEKMAAIVESQRLSTVLKIEPASLKVDPAKFEPNKERLLGRMIEELLVSKNWVPGNWKRDPSTAAFCVLNHSGFDQFVDAETRGGVQNTLARLIVNGEMDEARRFLQEVVDKL